MWLAIVPSCEKTYLFTFTCLHILQFKQVGKDGLKNETRIET